MRPTLEKIEPGFGSSFTIRKFAEVQCNVPYWHFHPEYEIVYVSNGRGKRHIGSHISYFEDGDLTLLGPNLPHFGFTEEIYEQHLEIVLQMKEDFLGPVFIQKPELLYIRNLWERAKVGISFYGKTKEIVGRRLEEMLTQDPFTRLVSLLEILQFLATSEEYHVLNANAITLEVNAQDRARIQAIYEFVEANFQRPISLEEVATVINMTVPAFCRYFKRMTRKTFTSFVNEYRIAFACRLLNDEALTIAAIGYESGFNNLSHFNKQFRQTTGITPREYRANLTRIVAQPG